MAVSVARGLSGRVNAREREPVRAEERGHPPERGSVPDGRTVPGWRRPVDRDRFVTQPPEPAFASGGAWGPRVDCGNDPPHLRRVAPNLRGDPPDRRSRGRSSR
jgi:hypothetical protein